MAQARTDLVPTTTQKKVTKVWAHVPNAPTTSPTVPLTENKLFGAGFHNRKNACAVEVGLELVTHMACQPSMLALLPDRLREIINTRHAGNDKAVLDLHLSCASVVTDMKWGKYGAIDNVLLGVFWENIDVLASLRPLLGEFPKSAEVKGLSTLLEPWKPRHAPWMILETSSSADSKSLAHLISTACLCKPIVWNGAFYQCVAIVRAVNSDTPEMVAPTAATAAAATASSTAAKENNEVANHFILDLASSSPSASASVAAAVSWFRYDSLYLGRFATHSKYQLLDLADPTQWNTNSIVALVLIRVVADIDS